MSVHEHNLQTIDQSSHSICPACGGCTCHTPQLLGMSCEEALALNPATYDHGWVSPMPKQTINVMYPQSQETDSDKALKELRKKLGASVDEDEAKFVFEMRRTALHWVEKNFSTVINFRHKAEMVEATERFLRTGSFDYGENKAANNG